MIRELQDYDIKGIKKTAWYHAIFYCHKSYSIFGVPQYHPKCFTPHNNSHAPILGGNVTQEVILPTKVKTCSNSI